MKLCPTCRTTLWPFVMVLFLTGIAGFMAWLSTSVSGLGLTQRIAFAGLSSLLVGAALLHYVLSCMRRHCHHRRSPDRGPSVEPPAQSRPA